MVFPSSAALSLFLSFLVLTHPFSYPFVYRYVCLKTLHDGDGPLPVADFAMDAQLTFFVKEVDSNGVPDMDDPGYEDQYPLEAIDVSASDFIAAVALPSFRATWESTGNENEVRHPCSCWLSSFRSLSTNLLRPIYYYISTPLPNQPQR